MDPVGAYAFVNQLVDQRPDRAKDILARCCKDGNILAEIMSCLIQTGSGQHPLCNPTNSLDIKLSPTTPAPYSEGPHPSASPHRQRLRRFSTSTRPYSPLSPPRTASSVMSHSDKGDIIAREYILLLVPSENGVDEKIVQMKTAQIKHSVIREDVVHSRGLTDGLTPAEPYYVSVPHTTEPDNYSDLPLAFAINLTWRRTQSNSTHDTIFYVVPENVLDCDVLLGYEDSGKGFTGRTKSVAAQSQRLQDCIVDGYHPPMRPLVPSPPAQSFHRSAMPGASSSATATQHHPFGHTFAPQHGHEIPIDNFQKSHLPSPITVLGSHAPHMEHPQPVRPSATPTGSISDADPNKNSHVIRVHVEWESASATAKLNLSAPSEAFFMELKQRFKRKPIGDRSRMTLLLKKDKQAPEDRSHELPLDEDDMEADWETTIAWLEKNKRDKTPNIYGTIEVGEG